MGTSFPVDPEVRMLIPLFSGGDRGSGSHWMYDAGPLVRKSIEIGSPLILVTFKYVAS